MMIYMEISGSNRIEQKTLELFETSWSAWKDLFKAFKFLPGEGRAKARRSVADAANDADTRPGHVLMYLEKDVEEAVEAAWRRSPSEGFALHNLAISMVMTGVRQVVPEVDAGACAPLQSPDRDIRRRFEKMGLEWNEAGNVNRQYAVFTPQPYVGGCEICMMRESCPKSRVRS